MSDDEIKAAAGRAYSKGYVAGRKRADKDDEIAARLVAREARFAMYMAAAMTGLLASEKNWQRGGKADSSASDYADTAYEIAKAMAKRHP